MSNSKYDTVSVPQEGSLWGICAEEEVVAAAFFDNVIQTRLVDGQLIWVPGLDSGVIDVKDNHLYIWAFLSNHGHGRTPAEPQSCQFPSQLCDA